jgi:RNA polymerase-binding transcription factor DksA
VPDLMDWEQETQMRELENIQQRARVLSQPAALPARSTGICKCGEPIDPRRLRLVPGATLCVPCAARHEIATRQFRRPRA